MIKLNIIADLVNNNYGMSVEGHKFWMTAIKTAVEGKYEFSYPNKFDEDELELLEKQFKIKKEGNKLIIKLWINFY